jgi:uncharacterized protein with HEPN domain
MSRDPNLYLDDILEACARIKAYVASLDYPAFVYDRKTQDAVIRNLEIIGEAAGRLPDSFKDATENVQWRKIIALRNILVHEYFGVSLPIVWDVIQTKLEPLKTACQKLLAKQ